MSDLIQKSAERANSFQYMSWLPLTSVRIIILACNIKAVNITPLHRTLLVYQLNVFFKAVVFNKIFNKFLNWNESLQRQALFKLIDSTHI